MSISSVLQHPSVLQYQPILQHWYIINMHELHEKANKIARKELLRINSHEKAHEVAHEIARIKKWKNEWIKMGTIRIKLATLRSLHMHATKVMNAHEKAGCPVRKYPKLPTSENLALIMQQVRAHSFVCSGNCPTCINQA